MKEGQKLWTRDELILAINLYCELPFGKLHSRNSKIIDFANLLGRTPGSIALKLVNFSSLDPSLQARGIKGMGNASKLDAEIWSEFYNNWDEAIIESEKLRAKKEKTTIERLNKIDFSDLSKEGKEKDRVVATRVNQAIFRKIILATYNETCCITGITNTDLLIASHIVPWSKDEKNRLKPTNGLCLNALHDKAFDKGLITICAANYTIKVSSKLKKSSKVESIGHNFLKLEGRQMNLPDKFLPQKEFLKIHNDDFFDR